VEVTLKGEYFISSAIQESDLIQAIQSAFEKSGLTPIPDMEDSRKRESLQQRIDQIKRARFGIYDLSAPEKTDTYLELGAALALGKEVIIIYKKGFSLPEMMKQLNRIEYENVSDLAEKLKKIVHP
jgi:nucleoside 2-deoxyribosyltransferase